MELRAPVQTHHHPLSPPSSLAASARHGARLHLERAHVEHVPLPLPPVRSALRCERCGELQTRKQHLRVTARHRCANASRELRFRQGSIRDD